jgi:hypothetical protein
VTKFLFFEFGLEFIDIDFKLIEHGSMTFFQIESRVSGDRERGIIFFIVKEGMILEIFFKVIGKFLLIIFRENL